MKFVGKKSDACMKKNNIVKQPLLDSEDYGMHANCQGRYYCMPHYRIYS
jgi:hypothetical protein